MNGFQLIVMMPGKLKLAASAQEKPQFPNISQMEYERVRKCDAKYRNLTERTFFS
ncbi:hypothetical protein H6G81_32925 [Scytonema hofmannii FACHB-248]|uniref:Uncharacterized protein n=1 Tax=Scytonema hofmannii FACHB-248 TaxID=1842502 RepID=A0ABR8H1H8_9CYAN|nr:MULTISPECIES: hypothetical protein [Nostocales]MBD2609192.1 hypothetical protein [Scytonema hofmannii FACHB-248]